MKVILSLGAGVQSSTLALMAASGEIGPMPECAIFSDTQAEPRKVYEWLDWLEKQLPFPVHRVTAGSLYDSIMRAPVNNGTETDRFVSVPFFTDFKGSAGMTRRQCTREFKIAPIEKKLRGLLGLKKGERGPKEPVVERWIGISYDEMQRMKDSDKSYITHRWPLIEKRMTRRHCLEWMEAKGYPMPSKSSCTFCPYHDEAMWRDMKANDPESWNQAVAVDRHIRSGTAIVQRGLNASLYLHHSLKPLESVDLRSAEEAGQSVIDFNSECEGMCGV